MQPHDSTSTRHQSIAKNATLRYGLSLVLLVLIVGGIAWLVQFLPTSGPKKTTNSAPQVKTLLKFTHLIAVWVPPKPEVKDAKGKQEKKESALRDKEEMLREPVKEVEPGTTGHYDFLFKNVAGEDVEITHFENTCDCTNLKASLLTADEWERADKVQAEKPGDAIVYTREPNWQGLHSLGRKVDDDNPPKKSLVIKPDEGGVIRVNFVANKGVGTRLNIHPVILHHTVSDPNRVSGQTLVVPVRVQAPVQFFPARVSDVYLTPGGAGEAKFIAWSATRDHVNFTVEAVPPDKRIVVSIKPATEAETPRLQELLTKNADASKVLALYRVNVTLHENKGGEPMEQGAFYRKLYVMLDGRKTESDIANPEITGRVQSDIDIGGPDDFGRIRFKSFDAKLGSSKTVQLFADAKAKLQPYRVHPDWVKVTLEPVTSPPAEGRRQWELTVEVPEGKGERSFNDLDAVLLRIIGPTDRFVRIPLEGNIRGGK